MIGRTVNSKPNNLAISGSLLLAVVLWGANNTGTKFLVGGSVGQNGKSWPPVFVGCTRFLAAGMICAALLRWTPLLGTAHRISVEMNRKLWLRCGLVLAAYIIAFNWALKLTAASHVVLYLGASPVWALLWEGRLERNWKSLQRYGAASLALVGVMVLFWPTLAGSSSSTSLLGEILGLTCSVLWTAYGRQCRSLGTELSGAEISAHSFWRAGLFLAPLGLYDYTTHTVPWTTSLVLVQLFCIVGGGIISFALWTSALRHWSTSKVYLFNNMIPLSTMTWANFCLGEPVTHTFWIAMVLIATGVILGQTNWEKIFGARWLPEE